MAGDQNSLDTDIDNVFGTTLGDDNTASQQEDTTQDTSAEQADTSQQADEPTQQPEDRFAEFGEAPKGPPQRDAQGRIIDAQGRTLQNRQEKRDFYAYNRLRAAADKVGKRNDQLEAENRQLQHIAALPQQLGLNLKDVQEAMQFRADYNRDPVGTVRDIVARALNNGYTMDQLFGGEAAGIVNAKMMQQAIGQHLQPLNARLAEQTREERIHSQATNDLNAFVSEHEFADVHGENIAQLVAEQGMSPQKAYYELRSWADRNGLDFSQPLREQALAKLEQLQQQQRNGGQSQQTQQRPSTPGMRRTSAGTMPTQPASPMASPSDNFKDIVASAFRDLAQQGTQH